VAPIERLSVGDLTILGVLSSAITFFLGLWSATYLQDRAMRRRHLGLVRALRADVSRIYSEVGAKNPVYITVSFFGASPLIPRPSPWAQTLAAELASTNPVYVGLLMELDRYLTNLAGADKVEDAAMERMAMLKEAVSVHEKNHDPIAAMTTGADLSNAEQATEFATFSVGVDFKNVKTALESLQNELSLDEKQLAGGLFTHLPWSRRR